MRENPARVQRSIFYRQLHCAYGPHAFDNWLVWAGNMSVEIDGIRCASTLARAYIGPQQPTAPARVRAELFVAAADLQQVRAGDLDARLWTDANQRGGLDARGAFCEGAGFHLPMRLLCDAQGRPAAAGNNLVFESEVFLLDTTGVFNYTVEFSADECAADDPDKEWIAINEMAANRDGVLVVSPEWVRRCPAIAEVCTRKVGARLEEGRFRSGTFVHLRRQIEHLAAEVVYLLPFFKPGFFDLHTGADVRKGTLGSVYAVADFYRVDPRLVTPPAEADLAALVAEGLIEDGDVEEWLGEGAPPARELARRGLEEILALAGREALVQLVGRAELRALIRRAHALGKRVIFDLVLMQTSRDHPLIAAHPEWYVRDDQGRPRIHRIAWLVYSDVALFDLVFNQPLQEYLLAVAPHWIETCGFDGVRIDASQTVDRPFLKQIKNRINAVHPRALVLAETLCPLEEAVDIPADMIYALLVDFHRDLERAAPLIHFLEEMHRRLAPRTVALAYFENHDSARATRVWRQQYAQCLGRDPAGRRYWRELESPIQRDPGERPLLMALLKNLQAALIDLSAGMAAGTSLACGFEWGSDWGEEARTDFENETLLHPQWRVTEPRATLVRAYRLLHAEQKHWEEVRRGRVYYQRNEFAGGDPADRIFAYVRYTEQGALLALHNLDPVQKRCARYGFDYLSWKVRRVRTLFDTYEIFRIEPPPGWRPAEQEAAGFVFELLPLQSRILRLY